MKKTIHVLCLVYEKNTCRGKQKKKCLGSVVRMSAANAPKKKCLASTVYGMYISGVDLKNQLGMLLYVSK